MLQKQKVTNELSVFWGFWGDWELQDSHFCLLVCKKVVNGIDEYGFKCDTLTKTRPDFCWGGVLSWVFWSLLELSQKALLSCCWGLVDTVPLRTGPVSKWDQVAWGHMVMVSLLNERRLPVVLPRVCPGLCCSADEGTGGDVTSLLVVLAHLEQ